MTRKKFRIFMTTFIIVSVSVLSGFMINNLKKRNVSNPKQNEVVSEELSDGNYSSSKTEQLRFYVNENNVKKKKEMVNEITKFSVESKLFITNNGSKKASIDPDAFTISYDTEGTGLLYDIDYGNIENPLEIEAGASVSISFVVSYIINDAENFNFTKKSELRFNYMDKQILVCSV